MASADAEPGRARDTTESYPRVLSTRFTFFFKFVFPASFLTLMAGVTALLAYVDVRLTVVVLLVNVPIVALFWFYAWPIKRVVAYRDHLTVSNYRREARIAYDQIESVHEVRWINWRPTVVTLRTPGPFGRQIVYYPAVDSLFGGSGMERSATAFLRRHVAPR